MFPRFLAGSVLAAVVLAVAPPARAEFALVSQDLTVSRQAAVVDFSLTFNQPPDFRTIDAAGIPVNSFQVEFNGNAALPADMTAVVRGDEIHLANAVRVRSPVGDGGPDSGGWGPITGSVPFSLTGSTVSFAVPGADLGWTGGAWQASTYSLAYGDLTAQQSVSSVPAPPAFWGGLAGLGVVAGLSIRRTAVRRRTRAGYLPIAG